MKLTTTFSVILILALIGFGIFAMRMDTTSAQKESVTKSINEEESITTNTDTMNPEWNMNAAGLGIQIVTAGSGPAAQAGDTVVVNYTGTLEDGTMFDSSLKPGREPFSFTLGTGQVIAGWEQGILGMQVGEKRRLNIPASLGYGATGAGGVIPPNATLLFDVELLAIE